ncbi:hypothetical protein [Geopsychrobacter electrodiphilus]|uniref:hypothetical protein n=1 Tax=Geopsychrobacter electrodiphilus TaxID=225196 RepID=UPI000376300D|nr:hypothetical protein [Geopsychrobacter electrodiphilus]
MQTMSTDPFEVLRLQYKPETIKILFIGESRPQNGTFFYKNNSNLSIFTHEALILYRPDLFDSTDFLQSFKKYGCYLVDLCEQPVNGLTRTERRNIHKLGEPNLKQTINELNPDAIIVVIKGIRISVESVLAETANSSCPLFFLPFPALGHQHQYVDQLHKALERLSQTGII